MFHRSLCAIALLSSLLAACGPTKPEDETPTCTPATEVCDGVDNDCDGQADEGCECVNGTEQTCSTGPEGTRDVGACVSGTQTCVDGTWSACMDEVAPKSEACNGLDDDCDGQVDEGCECVNDTQRTCYSGPEETQGVSVCVAGIQTCMDGAWSDCVGEVAPTTETCNGVDDDCDGQIDEGCDCVNGTHQSCYAGPAGTQGLGVCKAGTRTCAEGRWGACAGAVGPVNETCNGLDDDCDGVVDEGC